jgi:hypothetical protein
MAEFALAGRQSASDLAQRLRVSQLAKQHRHELRPAAEAPGMALRLVLSDGSLNLEPQEQLLQLGENAGYSFHGGGLLWWPFVLGRTQTTYQSARRRLPHGQFGQAWISEGALTDFYHHTGAMTAAGKRLNSRAGIHGQGVIHALATGAEGPRVTQRPHNHSTGSNDSYCPTSDADHRQTITLPCKGGDSQRGLAPAGVAEETAA